ETGSMYALSAAGAPVWHFDTGDTLNVGPAVVPSATTPATDQVVVPGALTTSKVYSVANGALLQTTAPAVANSNSSSAPLILNGGVFFGNASRMEKHTISAAGVIGAATTSSANSAATYFEVITDGTSLFAWRS